MTASILNITKRLLWPTIFVLLAFVALNRHSKSKTIDYHYEIWADKAGYYIYLPSSFIYYFDAKKFPEKIDSITGNGFELDLEKNVIKTKYPYGVALLQSPFFLATYIYCKTRNDHITGFESVFARSISISAVFWLCLGLYFTYRILLLNTSKSTARLVTLSALLATNLFYYGTFDTGMSHVYSFFAFSHYLFLFQNTVKSKFYYYQLGLSVGLIIALRPINVVFLPLPIILSYLEKKISYHEIYNTFINWRTILTGSILILPQLLYWFYLTGSPLYFAYEGESFSNLLNPEILKFLFSTNNGLLLYTPFWLLIILFPILKSQRIQLIRIFFFLSLVYLFSSWWSWNYGCGYGARCLVEYLPFFLIPFAQFIETSAKKNMLFSAIFVLASINIKMIFTYDMCWNFGDWNWKQFIKLITGPTK